MFVEKYLVLGVQNCVWYDVFELFKEALSINALRA